MRRSARDDMEAWERPYSTYDKHRRDDAMRRDVFVEFGAPLEWKKCNSFGIILFWPVG